MPALFFVAALSLFQTVPLVIQQYNQGTLDLRLIKEEFKVPKTTTTLRSTAAQNAQPKQALPPPQQTITPMPPPEDINSLKKVVSYSVYGQRPKYVQGMVEVAKMLPKFFPGWEARVYHDNSVPGEGLQELTKMPYVTLINVSTDPSLPPWVATKVNPMVWRFLIASDPTVDVYLIRDSDSRPSAREKAAVDEWLRSNTSFHIMRDNSMHDPSTFAAMLGGMWGARHRAVPNMMQLVEKYYHHQSQVIDYGEDQHFLWKNVLPLAKDDCLQHDSHHCVASGGIAFPLSSQEAGDDPDDFVGSVVMPPGKTIAEGYQKDMFKTTKRYLDCLQRRKDFLADRQAKGLSTTVLPATPFIGNMVIPTERDKQ